MEVGKGRRSKYKEPFVSVLTPVYNGEEYLRECIESVLNQTYKNWEYVLVNNKSDDRTLEIIEEYAKQDNRIRIYNNKEFLPQMKNLNHAFRQISPESKYCKVILDDDWLFPECISRMVEVSESYPSVGIVSSYRLDDKRTGLSGLPYSRNFYTGNEIAREHFLDGTFYFGSPSSLLLRCDLIRKQEKFYEESHQGSDTGACLNLLGECDFGFVHQVLTFTRRHDKTITNTEAKESHAYIHARLFSQLTYGPHFLSEKEHKKCFADDLKRFYTMLIRNFYESRSKEVFKRQLKILEELGLKFEARKFLKILIRESILQFFKMLGVELKKLPKKKRVHIKGTGTYSIKSIVGTNTYMNQRRKQVRELSG